MKNNKLKIILSVIAGLLIVIGIFAGVFIYKTRYEKIKIDYSVSDDGKYTITLYSVGEPDFPFGYCYGKIILESNGTKVSETDIDLADDGGQISAENWKVLWMDDLAYVILSAEEQPDEEWQFYFDGKTQFKPAEFVSSYNNTDKDLEIESTMTEQGKAVFNVKITDLIAGINRKYKQDYYYSYLSDLSKWSKFNDVSPYYQYSSIHYHFVTSEQINSLPTVSVYMPEDENGIYEIKLTFDDHGYTDKLYKEFTQITESTLKALMPQLSGTEISKIYDLVYAQTNDNLWGNYTAERPKLKKIYCYKNIGMYGYYGKGSANICIIPFTESLQRELTENGVKIEIIG